MKIVVTGFDPFGGEKINPAFEAVKRLPNTLKNHELIKLEIPTVFEKAAVVMEAAMVTYQPDIIVNVGQAGGRFGITPERVAINVDDARIADNEGKQPIDQMIQTDGAPAYFSQLPIKAMVAAMSAKGVPASISNSAGTFVCNHIMYQVLYLIEKKYPTMKAGFIHVPYITQQVTTKSNQPSMSLEMIVLGLEIALETILQFSNLEDIKAVGGALN